MKAVICAIAKFEYNYIKEWVEYHLNLGFDKIVIYDNNDIDGERYDELLSEFIQKGQVELRDVRGKRAMQRVVYNEFYHEGDFDWVAIIDIDEFISPNRTKYKTIKDFLNTVSEHDAVFLYWQTYGDAGKTYPISKNPRKNNEHIPLLSQYSIPADKNCLIDNAIKRQNAWGKSIIKAGLPVNYLHEHFITSADKEIDYVDCFGEEVSPMLFFPEFEKVERTYRECYIKHIYTKSLYEYIDCKVRRPAANTMGIMHFPSKYFKVNEINEEKRKYLESIGYKMEFVFKPDAYFIVELKNLDEYYKLKPYILNVINLCSCRFACCVTQDESAVDTISKELGGIFNECMIYYQNKENGLTTFNTIYLNDRENVVNHSNCVVHMNIPYNVDTDAYINKFIDPIFNETNIEDNFLRVFNTENSIYVAKDSIIEIDKNSETYKEFKDMMQQAGVHTDLSYVAYTGNFIAKTKDCLKYKHLYDTMYDELEDPEMLMYFISNMFNQFLYIIPDDNK